MLSDLIFLKAINVNAQKSIVNLNFENLDKSPCHTLSLF